jgi:membrane associated rhomboid family serine protease
MFNLTPMVKNLLLINVGIFLADAILPFELNRQLALYFVDSELFRPYQIVTHMFTHANLGHLFSNMFAVFIFGPMLERVWGSNKFLIFYIVTGLGASMLYTFVEAYQVNELREMVSSYSADPTPEAFEAFIGEHSYLYNSKIYDFIEGYNKNPEGASYIEQSTQLMRRYLEDRVNIPLMGASGAVFGILMAFAMMFPNVELFLIFIPIPIKAKYFVAFYGLFELYSEVFKTPGDNIAHLAHLGGMLFGFILLKMWGMSRYGSGH